jgi:hypothetical protein
MAIYFGNDKIKEIYVGSDKIKEVYYGSELVYTAHDPRGYWVHKDTGVKTYFGLDADFITGGVMSSPPWKSDCSEVNIPEGVTSLGYACFYNCTSLTSITFPESVTSMGVNCFNGCTSLTLATVLPATPPSLGWNVFTNVHPSFNIKVRSPYVDDYKTATNWTAYASIISAI